MSFSYRLLRFFFHQIAFVEAGHNLIARLIDDDHLEQAARLVQETIAGYRQYSRLPGADTMRVGRDLAELAALMTRVGRTAEAAAAQRAADDLSPAAGVPGAGDTVGTPTLRSGSHGPAVRKLQRLLNAHVPDIPPLAVDGVFGPVTDGRVRKFQRRLAVVVDGTSVRRLGAR
ncbi:peptidoglycan-binding protein [Streptomyces sp. LUP47B]|uniref:peptidoglycan-binding domain-containing protein n=1 Tax=Streptomyces sp. LUP47B TaxID=1890286 RepID=UPI000AC649FE|nr:peptidoglycan-binding domain-containing protein [Streptomyces sp. LUP47B]